MVKEIIAIDSYIAQFPKEVQVLLERMRTTIRKAAPNSTETISYRMPAFKMGGILVWFAAHKNHIGFYPREQTIKSFIKELEPYKKSKGSVRFPFDEPLPLTLVRKIVEFRVKQESAKKK